MQQDEHVFQLDSHFVRVGDEVRRQVAAVELHAFDDFNFGLKTFVFFDSDHAFVANALHGVSNKAADLRFAIGRDCADLGDFVRILDRTRGGFDRSHNLGGGHVDAALQIHRVHAGGDGFHAFANDGLGQNGGGGGAVTGFVVGAGSDFLHHLRAHVFELVSQFDFLGNRHTVFGDARCAKGLVDHDIAAFGAQGHFDSIGQNVDATQHAVAGIGVKTYVFSSHCANSRLNWLV